MPNMTRDVLPPKRMSSKDADRTRRRGSVAAAAGEEAAEAAEVVWVWLLSPFPCVSRVASAVATLRRWEKTREGVEGLRLGGSPWGASIAGNSERERIDLEVR